MEQRTKDLKRLAEAGVFSGESWPTPADLADAQAELEVERVERALAWQEARSRAKQAQVEFKAALKEATNRIAARARGCQEYGCGVLLLEGGALLEALEGLERLEGNQ